MARRAIITLPALTLRLQAQGPQTALQLAAAAGVDRSQVSRTLAAANDAVVQIGAARRARYALRRPVRTIGARWPIFRIDDVGRAHEWGELEAFHGGFRMTWAATASPLWAGAFADVDGWVDGCPFFVSDLRPQGFLGRALARRLSDSLLLPADPTRWSDDDTLVFLQTAGDDLPGNLVVGETPLRRALAQPDNAPDWVADSDRATRYPALAAESMQTGVPGSSAGGEQPKFLVYLQPAPLAAPDVSPPPPQAVLVKFSQPLDTPSGRRWADLLAAESHALAILTAAGEAAGEARVLDAGGRRFLEVPRFDRVGAHGRRGVVSLGALHEALGTGPANTWVQAAETFAATGLIAPEALGAIRRRHAFGELIGNIDMHFGNLAFWLDDSAPFRLAPAYDMLPMLWAPTTGGEIVPRTFAPLPPSPTHAADWSIAAHWAAAFWQRVAADPCISPEFAATAHTCAETISRLITRFSTA
ncbi:MAG: type II toxin-antitoxin system HipA family toxin YjjJ [Verrucomicrobia bacterium]|nr:type II toxin-antitoxin system HipA family toxin YjjJ [Verrucomicrobiota bacterium]